MANGLRAGRRAARSGRRGRRRLDPPERAAGAAGPGAARRGGDHLREPAQRHQRRLRAVPEGRQRRVPPRLVGRDPLEHRHRRRRSARAWPRPGCPHDSLVLVEDTRHEAAVEFMRLRESIDVLIPRGGPSLIRSVLDNATVPYVIDGDGNCHVYVDATADLAMAATIVENAKTQRPSVCNAAETLLVHRNIAATLLSEVAPRLEGVELVGDEATREILGDRVVGHRHRRRLRHRVPRPEARRPGGRHARRRHRPHHPLRQRAQRGHRHQRPASRRPLRQRGRRRRGAGQRLHPVRRRRGARLRRRDRHLHPEAPRPRARWACASSPPSSSSSTATARPEAEAPR